MIIRIMSSGRSFKGLAQYLCHDAGRAETSERVAWTHSLNCAHDDPLSVVHEMHTTMLDADLLKQEAGGRAGYAPIKKPVKHVSLSWHESDEPTREHMIEATQEFLKHMGWDGHQAMLAAHADTAHPHVHVMLNAIHPETGLKLEERFERRRAQDWALDYERAQDRIHCEQRLLNENERLPQMSRDAWQEMKDAEKKAAAQDRHEYDPDYIAKEDKRQIIAGEEWKILKEFQRKEREAFMAENKELYREARKEAWGGVREEMREEWAAYYADKREGGDADQLASQRLELLDRQKALIGERTSEAFAELRLERGELYDELKAEHRQQKADLRQRQEDGLNSPHLLDLVNREPEPFDIKGAEFVSPAEGTNEINFAPAAQDVSAERVQQAEMEIEPLRDPPAIGPKIRDPVDGALAIGLGGLGGIAMFGERLFDGLLGGGEARKPSPRQPKPEPEFAPANPFAQAASLAQRQVDEHEEKRSRDYWDDRERQRD